MAGPRVSVEAEGAREAVICSPYCGFCPKEVRRGEQA